LGEQAFGPDCRQLKEHDPMRFQDVPRGIIADIVEELGITRDEFYFGKF
jgi:hypothetical protein